MFCCAFLISFLLKVLPISDGKETKSSCSRLRSGECSSAPFWKEWRGLFRLHRQSQEAPDMQGGHCSWEKVTTKSLVDMTLHLQDFLFWCKKTVVGITGLKWHLHKAVGPRDCQPPPPPALVPALSSPFMVQGHCSISPHSSQKTKAKKGVALSFKESSQKLRDVSVSIPSARTNQTWLQGKLANATWVLGSPVPR